MLLKQMIAITPTSRGQLISYHTHIEGLFFRYLLSLSVNLVFSHGGKMHIFLSSLYGFWVLGCKAFWSSRSCARGKKAIIQFKVKGFSLVYLGLNFHVYDVQGYLYLCYEFQSLFGFLDINNPVIRQFQGRFFFSKKKKKGKTLIELQPYRGWKHPQFLKEPRRPQ